MANIAPGSKIDVVISYVQTLTYDAGQYEFVFPMVVGPRYNPGSPLGKTGTGTQPDTTRVPDASRISPSYMGDGERNGHDISIDVVARPGFPITSWDVPTHKTTNESLAGNGLHVTLSASDKLPNRDFVLHYNVAAAQSQVALITHGDGKNGEFELIVQPPVLDIDRIVGKREIIFVVDVSGSMSGVPLAMCKDAMREALRKLRPMDTFNVLVFASNTGQAFAEPRPASDANILDGIKYVDGLSAGGGTEMADAVAAALQPSSDKERHRYVFFMTDGYVGNEDEIIAKAAHLVDTQKHTGARARVFGFGVGSSVNRMLIDGLGKSGEGAAVYATTREDPVNAVNTFFRIIDAPVIENLTIDWGTAKVSDVYPSTLPDLFASRPTIIHGRFSGEANTTVTVKGEANGKHLQVSTKASFAKTDSNAALGSLWARSKVEDLERSLWNGPDASVVDAITQVGLAHHLVTAYTSFVAVDTSTKVDGKLVSVNQPSYAPEGVDLEMAGGEYRKQKVNKSVMPMQAPRGGYKTGSTNGGIGAVGGHLSQVQGQAYGAQNAPTTPAPRLEKDAAKSEDERSIDAKDDRSAAVRAPAEPRAESLLIADGIDKAKVRTAFASIKPQLDALLAQAGFKGKLALRWLITKDGAVLQLKIVEGNLGTATVQQITELLRQAQFPSATQERRSR